MRNLWLRIGIGAAAVFAAGLVAISVGRQVKAQVANAISNGGRVTVPLALLPFQVGQDKVGSIRQVDVERAGQTRRITIEVKLKDAEQAARFDQCLFKADAPDTGGLFACVPEGSPEADGLVRIGEIRIEPGGLRRPLVLSRDKAGDWADGSDGSLSMKAGEQGVMLHATDQSGAKVVELQADSNGAFLNVRDDQGRKVVRIKAGSGGVQIDVKKDSARP
jgi:hypothetical protein